MSDRIEQAARVLFEGAEYGTWDDAEGWERVRYWGHAYALKEAGLLATREEWAVQTKSSEPCVMANRAEAQRLVDLANKELGENPRMLRRLVTEWEAVE